MANHSPHLNLKIRGEHLEAQHYLKGVYNEDDEQVIRPLNSKELAFINKFEAETVCFDYYHTPKLREAKQKLDDCISWYAEKLIGKELKELNVLLHRAEKIKSEKTQKREVTKINRRIKQVTDGVQLANVRKYIVKEKKYKEVVQLEKALTRVRRQENLYSSKKDRTTLNILNNTRNKDLFSILSRQGDLLRLDLDEYDRFTSERLESIDPEHLIINDIEPLN